MLNPTIANWQRWKFFTGKEKPIKVSHCIHIPPTEDAHLREAAGASEGQKARESTLNSEISRGTGGAAL
jgi:hypothetical protein